MDFRSTLKKNYEFKSVYKSGRSLANKLLIMYVSENGGQRTRIGISASKKVGNSVVRHRVTRLLREVFRLNEDRLGQGLDIVIVVRAAAKDSDFKKIESAFMHLCGLHNILENRSESVG